MNLTDQHWSPDDTLAIRRITSLGVSPDGRRLAFTVMQVVMTSKPSGFRSQVYLTDPEGSQIVRLTAGECSSFAPQWSPDGSMIAFTVADGPTPAEIDVAQGKNSVRIVGQGLKKQRLHLISLAELSHGPGSGCPLTTDEIHVGAPEVPEAYNWLPDSNAIVFAHFPSPQLDDWPGTRLALLNLSDGSIQPLGGQDTTAYDPHISPDGCWIAYKAYDTPAWEWSSVVHVLPLTGGDSRPLAETRDRRPDLIGWSGDGQLYYLETTSTHHCLGTLPVDGSPPVLLFEWEGCIENARLNQSRSAMGFTLQTPSQPPEAFLTPLDDISPVQMSRVNAEFCQIPLGRTEVIRWRSVDGLEIEGLLTYPVDYEMNRRYPLLVSVHGGPAIAWLQSFIGLQSFYGPIAAFAARGYAILRCNVRGSTGYGKAFRRGIPTQMVVYPRTGHFPSEPNLLLDIMERILAWMELYLA